jgi:hypothetical protein
LTGPSWFGRVTGLWSAGGYGYAVSLQRFDAVSCGIGADGVPMSSTIRNRLGLGQLNRTRMMRFDETAFRRACCSSERIIRCASPSAMASFMLWIAGIEMAASVPSIAIATTTSMNEKPVAERSSCLTGAGLVQRVCHVSEPA